MISVCKGVHRVDDDSPRAPGFPCLARPDAGIDDRHGKAHRFARTSSGRDDEALVRPCFADCLDLVVAKPESPAVLAEDLGGFRQNGIFGGKLVRGGTVLERRVYGQKGSGPKPARRILRLDV